MKKLRLGYLFFTAFAIAFFAILFSFAVHAANETRFQYPVIMYQNLSVGDSNAAAADALLDLKSTTKGLLPPRMTTTQKNAISSPDTGLLVFDTSLGLYQFYNGASWTSIGGGANTALSNLTTTSISASLLPATANTYTLGSSSHGWQSVYGYGFYATTLGLGLSSPASSTYFSIGSNTSINSGQATADAVLKSNGNTSTALGNSTGLILGTAKEASAATQDLVLSTGDAGAGNSGYIRFQIGTATGTQGHFTFNQSIDVGSHLITSVTDPVSAQDAATKNYVDIAPYLPLAGGTMSGAINMGTNGISNTGALIPASGAHPTLGNFSSGSDNLSFGNAYIRHPFVEALTVDSDYPANTDAFEIYPNSNISNEPAADMVVQSFPLPSPNPLGMLIGTGADNARNSQPLRIVTGQGVGGSLNSGDIVLRPGDAAGSTGNVQLFPPPPGSGTRGHVGFFDDKFTASYLPTNSAYWGSSALGSVVANSDQAIDDGKTGGFGMIFGSGDTARDDVQTIDASFQTGSQTSDSNTHDTGTVWIHSGDLTAGNTTGAQPGAIIVSQGVGDCADGYCGHGIEIDTDGTGAGPGNGQIRIKANGNVLISSNGAAQNGSVTIDSGNQTMHLTTTDTVDFGNSRATSIGDALADTDAVNIESMSAQLGFHKSVKTATITALPANTYHVCPTGPCPFPSVRASLNANSVGALPAIDGVTLVNGDRLLVKNEATAWHNGIYYVFDVGSGGTGWVLTRAQDSDRATTAQGASVFVLPNSGATNTNRNRFFFEQALLADLDGTSTPSWVETHLSLRGGTMAGVLDMGTNQITNVVDPSSAQAAATKNYVDTSLNGQLKTLNSQSGPTQVFANDSNVVITSSANTHSLGWNGTLPINRGGTNNGSLSTVVGGVVYTDATKLNTLAAGTSGQLLSSKGAAAPTWAEFVNLSDLVPNDFYGTPITGFSISSQKVFAATQTAFSLSSSDLDFSVDAEGPSAVLSINTGSVTPTNAGTSAPTGSLFIGTGNIRTGPGPSPSPNTGETGFISVNTGVGENGATVGGIILETGALDYPETNTVTLEAGYIKLKGAISAETHLISNVVDPTNAQDAATKSYVDTSAGRIRTLNSQTGATQVFANDSNIIITSSANTHTLGFNGTLPIARGGTNNGSLGVANGGIVYTDGSKLADTAAGTSGQILTSTGSGAPTWVGNLTIAEGGTNNSSLSVASGVIYYGDGSKLVGLAAGTSGQVLLSKGASAPEWTLPYKTAVIKYQVSNTFEGAGTGSLTFDDRKFNSLDDPAGLITSVSSNVITVTTAGTYLFWANCPFGTAVGLHQTRLYNNTGSAQMNDISGVALISHGNDAVNARIDDTIIGDISVTAGQAFKIQSAITTHNSNNDFGASAGNGTDIYCQATFTWIKP